jgi:hypothetical protein
VGNRPVFEVGDDLFDDRVRAVRCFGGGHRQRAVGEHGVVAVGGEQFALVGRVEVFDPAHDQPGGDLFGFGPGAERGVGNFGDFRVGYPPLLLFVEDRVGVFDGGPRVGFDGGDRLADRRFWRAVTEKRVLWRMAAAMTSAL